MSRERRRGMVDRQHPALSTVRQCALLDISRSSLYYRPKGVLRGDLALMKLIDQQYLVTPFYGSRRIRVWLSRQGHQVSRKRVQRLMRTMGLQAIYRRPRTSQPAPRHKVYPYLLSGMEITRPNQVWAAKFQQQEDCWELSGGIRVFSIDILLLPDHTASISMLKRYHLIAPR